MYNCIHVMRLLVIRNYYNSECIQCICVRTAYNTQCVHVHAAWNIQRVQHTVCSHNNNIHVHVKDNNNTHMTKLICKLQQTSPIMDVCTKAVGMMVCGGGCGPYGASPYITDNTTILARVPFREKFARSCFEALLQFSFLHSQDSNIGNGVRV